jgi:dihydrofolate reductase
VVVAEFVSLDGVMEDPGGAEAFEHGGWTRPYWSDEIGKAKYEELFASDALLLGRVTYEGFAKAWPSMKDDQGFADRMNGLPKYVVSKTLEELTWNNSRLLTGNLADGVGALKQQPGKDILIAGSGQVVRALAGHDLIDEYRLLVYPVVLGSGKRLFGDGVMSKLRLLEARPVGAGVVLMRYEPDRGA